MKIRLDLDKTGTWESSGNYTSYGGVEVYRGINAKYINPNKYKAKGLINTVTML